MGHRSSTYLWRCHLWKGCLNATTQVVLTPKYAALRSRRLPEITQCLKSPDQLHHIFTHVGNIILIHAPLEQITRENIRHVLKGNDSTFGFRLESTEVMYMLFRPEEVHGTSGVGHIIPPLPEGR